MSAARQTVVRLPNLKGFGNLPVFTPAHQLDRLIGIN